MPYADHLKQPLDLYMAKFAKVQIVRTTKRVGLIRARTAGYKVAKGQVLVFLDAHCECSTGREGPI